MYDLIGDIHGQASELVKLLAALGYSKHKGGVTLQCVKRLSDTPSHRAMLQRVLEQRKGSGLDLI